jgi:hypothetical protein
MTVRTTRLSALSRASLVGVLAAIAVLVDPANANKDPVTPQQLQAYEEAFMEQVKIGDLLFHGDAATAKQMNVVLSNTGMACAMCHPFASDASRHDQLVYRETQPGREDRSRFGRDEGPGSIHLLVERGLGVGPGQVLVKY